MPEHVKKLLIYRRDSKNYHGVFHFWLLLGVFFLFVFLFVCLFYFVYGESVENFRSLNILAITYEPQDMEILINWDSLTDFT